MGDQGAFIAYYVVAVVSAICSIFVCCTLRVFGSLKTTATQLLLLLHLTLLCEELSSLPYVFNFNHGLCAFMAFLHFYAGFANAVSIGLLVVSYRYHFMDDAHNIMKFIHKHSVYLVTVVPLVTLLPFITNGYMNDNEVWCTMQTNSRTTNAWAFGTFYCWAWLIMVISTMVLSVTMYQVYSIDREIGMKMLSTTGMYAIISILSWVPRTASRFFNINNEDMDNTAFLYSYFPLYISGILYTIVFMREKKALLLFDRLSDWTGSDVDISVSFSWEDTAGSNLYYIDGPGRSRSSTCSATNADSKLRPKSGVYTPLITEVSVEE